MGTKKLLDRNSTISNSMEVLKQPTEEQNYLINLQIKATRKLFTDQFKAQRLLKGVSQADLAFYMNVTQNYVSRVEAGKVNISVDTLLKWAYFLDTVIFLRGKQMLAPGNIYFNI